MTTAIIYTNGNQECDRIRTLLETLPSITEILEYKLGKHFEKYQFPKDSSQFKMKIAFIDLNQN